MKIIIICYLMRLEYFVKPCLNLIFNSSLYIYLEYFEHFQKLELNRLANLFQITLDSRSFFYFGCLLSKLQCFWLFERQPRIRRLVLHWSSRYRRQRLPHSVAHHRPKKYFGHSLLPVGAKGRQIAVGMHMFWPLNHNLTRYFRRWISFFLFFSSIQVYGVLIIQNHTEILALSSHLLVPCRPCRRLHRSSCMAGTP